MVWADAPVETEGRRVSGNVGASGESKDEGDKGATVLHTRSVPSRGYGRTSKRRTFVA